MAESKPEVAASGSKKKIIIGAIATLVLIAGGVGAAWWLARASDADKVASAEDSAKAEEEETAERPPAIYVALEPAFVVNFQDQQKRTKFLKAEISVVTADPQAQEAIEQHMPAVRNGLVMLLSRQIFEELSSNEGREKLRGAALAEVQHVIEQQAGKKTGAAVKDLYFSSLVMQ